MYNFDFGNFVPGAILLTKTPLQGEIVESEERILHKKSVSVSHHDVYNTPIYSILFLTNTKSFSDQTLKFTCIFDGKFVDYYIIPERLDSVFSVIKLPSISDLDETDKWLTRYYRAHGGVFFTRKKITAWDGRLHNHNFSFAPKYSERNTCAFASRTPIIGVSVRRRTRNRTLAFEFLYENNVYWMDFKASLLRKDGNKTLENYLIKRYNKNIAF